MAKRNLVKWRRAVSEFEGSGLTGKAFAARKGVSAATFYRWQQEVRRADAKRGKSGIGKDELRLLPVEIVGSELPQTMEYSEFRGQERPPQREWGTEAAVGKHQLEITILPGVVLSAGPEVDANYVARVVRAIRSSGGEAC